MPENVWNWSGKTLSPGALLAVPAQKRLSFSDRMLRHSESGKYVGCLYRLFAIYPKFGPLDASFLHLEWFKNENLLKKKKKRKKGNIVQSTPCLIIYITVNIKAWFSAAQTMFCLQRDLRNKD